MKRSSASAAACVAVLVLGPLPARAEPDEEPEGKATEARPADADFDALIRETPEPAAAAGAARASGAGEVTLPLAELRALDARARRAREQGVSAEGPGLILGEGSYRCRLAGDRLVLDATLRGALARPGRWKLVPLLGTSAALRRVTVDGKQVSTAVARGYHVWPTTRGGPIAVRIEALIAAAGPLAPLAAPLRALEHELAIARTPVTRLACSLPAAGVEARVDGAVLATVRRSGGAAELEAILPPTTRLRMVSMRHRDLGAEPTEPARVFAEVLSLLSLDESGLELFSVVRYRILYASVRELQLEIPAGMTVVSVEGKGAFRHTLVPLAGGGALLRGETAQPIRDQFGLPAARSAARGPEFGLPAARSAARGPEFELSLRLRRDRAPAASFEVPLPRCRGVEREIGWLAVEVPGRLRLEELARAEVQALDARQLPRELVRSAVSPILRAYRYHDPRRRLRLGARRLPEQETAPEGVDRMRAFSVVSSEGGVLTELRLTLRNRMRRSLELTLPRGARLRSALIDGEPVRPSQARSGAVVIPLSRSPGEERPSPITVQVIVEDRGRALRWVGRPSLALPRVSLPAASLAWSVFLPGSNLYTRLAGAGSEETVHGHASWRRADGASAPAAALGVEPDPDLGTDAGSMPVRIKLPRVGVRLEHSRHWVGEGEEVAVRVTFLSRALLYPALVGAAALGVLALVVAAGWPRRTRLVRVVGALLAVAAAWPVAKLGGWRALAATMLLGAAVVAQRRGLPRRALAAAVAWGRGLPERYRQRPRADRELSVGRRVLRALLAGALVAAGGALAVTLLAIVRLLVRPLASP